MIKTLKTILKKLGIKKRYSQNEKKSIMFWKLSRAYSDYDKQTGNIDLHPVVRAKNTIKRMEEEGSVNYYFDFMQLNTKHREEVENLNKKYERKIS